MPYKPSQSHLNPGNTNLPLRIMMKIHLRDLEHVEHLTKLLLVFAPGQRSPSARANTVQLRRPLIPK